MIELSLKTLTQETDICISGSKSLSNRFLVLKHLYQNIDLHNLSDSDDTKHLQKALKSFDLKSEIIEIDVEHAGTAMRFLTALCAITASKTFVLKGSQRMHQRPIHILVDALQRLGADITYLEKEGYPPLKIKGRNLENNKVSISGAVSSQYISALLLIASQLQNGLIITLKDELTSKPYIDMSLQLLKDIGIEHRISEHKIEVLPKLNIESRAFQIESDWSSASYFYSCVAISKNLIVNLSNLRLKSLQGDASLVQLYQKFGVQTEQIGDEKIQLKKKTDENLSIFEADLIKTPDLAQTIAVSCLALGVNCHLKGLHTLKIKETDRLAALKNELEKFGAKVDITTSELLMTAPSQLLKNVEVDTYQDHRMAMAFAPLAILVPLKIKDEKVVSKSYPNFWNDLKKLGVSIKS